MNVKRLVGWAVVIFVLFWIISAPGNASGSVNNLLSNLNDAGTSMTNFVGGVIATDGSRSYDRDRDDRDRSWGHDRDRSDRN
ncbi:hypothetical protein GCM10023321_45900 [Pseudonocardia eucalypti]|uniref:Secreted protein n=1 Tax=Pseudonocardia eucalypti TaxID=648755 RepID=A0ABP9QGH6_9PSEU